mgnify:CR=1 FL=1
MDDITKNVSVYVKKMGINIKKISNDTGISYMALYDSLSNRGRSRELKAKEFISICKFLNVNPMDFVEEGGGEKV